MPDPGSATEHEQLREEFNRWAESGRGQGMEREHLPIVLPLLALLRLAPDETLLDVGCGTGWLVRLIAAEVPRGRVAGIDLSDEMIRQARESSAGRENVRFEVGSAEQIAFPDGSFTRVVSVESAYYWPGPAAALREIHRVLAAGGTAWILINYYRDNLECHQWRPLLPPTQLLSAEEWAGLFRKAGFIDVDHRRIIDPTPVPEVYAGRWFRDAAQLRRFRAQGALLVYGARQR
ncbi:MAG TPA: class I SAM-dependent methyltransferase [Candidatus Acidoferrales bacterium]|nr:class I SAM-dependent methyltransferase [Candidatus Acidoferrales bacterium]